VTGKGGDLKREEGRTGREGRSTNNVELLQSQHGNSIVNSETEAVGGEEVGGAGKGRGVRGVLGGLLGGGRGRGWNEGREKGEDEEGRGKPGKTVRESGFEGKKERKVRTFISTCLFPTFILTCSPHSSTNGV
jgi:hypothetical protein